MAVTFLCICGSYFYFLGIVILFALYTLLPFSCLYFPFLFTFPLRIAPSVSRLDVVDGD